MARVLNKEALPVDSLSWWLYQTVGYPRKQGRKVIKHRGDLTIMGRNCGQLLLEIDRGGLKQFDFVHLSL